MIKGSISSGAFPHCLEVYPRKNALKSACECRLDDFRIGITQHSHQFRHGLQNGGELLVVVVNTGIPDDIGASSLGLHDADGLLAPPCG